MWFLKTQLSLLYLFMSFSTKWTWVLDNHFENIFLKKVWRTTKPAPHPLVSALCTIKSRSLVVEKYLYSYTQGERHLRQLMLLVFRKFYRIIQIIWHPILPTLQISTELCFVSQNAVSHFHNNKMKKYDLLSPPPKFCLTKWNEKISGKNRSI